MIDYAAANEYMDVFASFQARKGKTYFHSINWPVWRESGSGGNAAAFCAQVGIDTIGNEEGLAVLEQIASLRSHPHLIPCRAIKNEFDPQALLGVTRIPHMETQPQTSTPLLPIDAPPPWLVDLFADCLQIPRTQLDPRRTFNDLGVESVLLAELLQKIEAHVGRPLEPAVLLDNPTLEQLSRYLAQFEQPRTNVEAAKAVPTGGSAVEAAGNRIAVIGIACRFPGAEDVTSFLENLVTGRLSVIE